MHTDQKRLRQILINLLSNAIKYTERGSVSLTVRYRSADRRIRDRRHRAGHRRARTSERIFEPFERGSSQGVRAIPGTGLGLTITKLLTQIMGGEVQVQQRARRQGSTFVVRLLLSGVSQDALAAARSAVESATTSGPRQRILLADDDPLHLELVQNLLRPLGFTVFVARDGKTCVQLAAQCQPDLAMIDLSLPDMSGWTVARELRATAGLAQHEDHDRVGQRA